MQPSVVHIQAFCYVFKSSKYDFHSPTHPFLFIYFYLFWGRVGLGLELGVLIISCQ